MMIKHFFINATLILFVNIVSAQRHTWYISANGNDANNGLSKLTAWKSLLKVNGKQFLPGDSILFEANQVFDGTILLDSADSGNEGFPVVFASYGRGKAIINAADSSGFLAGNASYINIINLRFKGNGVVSNHGTGIRFFSSQKDVYCSDVIIKNCFVEGFHFEGILFACAEEKNTKGYKNVTIYQCTATKNGQAGISSYGGDAQFNHANFVVSKCKAFFNEGIPDKTDNHSGNGIVMGGVQNILIDSCEAFENGAKSNCLIGGPVGIWVWLCKNAVIQHCESHHNRTGKIKDGGGFDIDGGSSNCVLQYNYSHDNEGAGFLLAEYGAGQPYTNNTIRFNISENDGLKNGYSGIFIWGVDEGNKVTNCFVYNNTIVVSDKGVLSGTPAGVATLDNHFKNVIIANNIFVTKGQVLFINGKIAYDTSRLYFLGNNYFSYNDNYSFQIGDNEVQGLTNWLKQNSGQETVDGLVMAVQQNPLFAKENIVSSSKTFSPNIFRLQAHSLMLKAGSSLPLLFQLPFLQNDFFGKPVNLLKDLFLGAIK